MNKMLDICQNMLYNIYDTANMVAVCDALNSSYFNNASYLFFFSVGKCSLTMSNYSIFCIFCECKILLEASQFITICFFWDAFGGLLSCTKWRGTLSIYYNCILWQIRSKIFFHSFFKYMRVLVWGNIQTFN